MTAQKAKLLKDNLYAIRYFIMNRGPSLSVLKATRANNHGPKTKYIDYLTSITYEPNVSIAKIAKILAKRASLSDWAIVFKSLIVIHHILNRGNQKFMQNLASSAGRDNLFIRINNFQDNSSNPALNMSTYLRRYARYLDSRIRTYRSLGIDFCRLESDGLRIQKQMINMSHDELMSTITALQSQFDMVVKFDVTISELVNGVIDQAFLMLYGDLVKLYISYQSSITRLLELFFSTKNASQARELYTVYSSFLVRMDMVQEFIQVVKSAGMALDDFPKFSRVPNIDLELIKSRLEHLENPKQTRPGNMSVSQVVPDVRTKRSKLTMSHSLASDIKPQIPLGNTEFLRCPAIGKSNRRSKHKVDAPEKDDQHIIVNEPVTKVDELSSELTDSYPQIDQKVATNLPRNNSSFLVIDHREPSSSPQPSRSENAHSLKTHKSDVRSQDSDFDLMVIDSDSSSSFSKDASSNTSIMNDAIAYVHLNESDLMKEVFPPVPQDMTTDIGPSVSENQTTTNRNDALDNQPVDSDTSEWVHIGL